MSKCAALVVAFVTLGAGLVRADDGNREVTVAANVLGPIVGYFDGAIDYAVAPHVTISASAARYDRQGEYDNHIGRTMRQYVASVPIYLGRTFSGPFIEPGIIYRYGTETSDISSQVTGSYKWVGPQLVAGWQWTSDRGLTASLAFGVAVHVTDHYVNINDGLRGSLDEPDINGYLRVGYNFSL